MKKTICITAFIIMFFGAGTAMAIEEAAYTTITRDGKCELRDYASHILAETVVEADMKDAGNTAFRRLFGYISGSNRTRQKVAMTAPVSQQPASEKISMTAPVGQQRSGSGWTVSFMMPASYTMDTLPEPVDPKVTLRQVPARRMASIRYSGFWSEEGYQRHLKKLNAWIKEQGFIITGDPVWARYDPPFKPWFLRRNEILIPVDSDTSEPSKNPSAN